MSRIKTTGVQGGEPPALGVLGSAAPQAAPQQCQICCDENAISLVTCPACAGSACIMCTKTFIIGGTSKHASCMHCGGVFTKELLFTYFPAKWMSEYKLYQRNFAIEREKSRLLATMDRANFAMKLESVMDEYNSLCDKIEKQYSDRNKFLIKRKINRAPEYLKYIDPIIEYITHDPLRIGESSIILFGKLINKINNSKSKTVNNVKTAIDAIEKYKIAKFRKNNPGWSAEHSKKLEEKCNLHVVSYINKTCFTYPLKILSFIIFCESYGEYYDIQITKWQDKIKKFLEAKIKLSQIDCLICKNKTLQINNTRRFCVPCEINYCVSCGLFAHIKDCNTLSHITPEILSEMYSVDVRQKNKNTLEFLKLRINNMRTGVDDFGEDSGPIAHSVAPLYKCAEKSCNGYVYTYDKESQIIHQCIICKKEYCPKCYENYHPDSKCNKDIIANLRAIALDTRPCPNCTVRVFKIEGCHQMFCTACNTPFDWATGKKIVNKTIHNPHYSEYLAKLNKDAPIRSIDDNHCDPNMAVVLLKNKKCNTVKEFKLIRYFPKVSCNYVSQIKRKPTNIAKIVDSTTGITQDYNKVLPSQESRQLYNNYDTIFIEPANLAQCFLSRANEIREYVTQVLAGKEKVFDDLRVQYIIKKINETAFSNAVGLAELKFEKFEAIVQIINNFAQIVDEYLTSLTLDNYMTHLMTLYDIYTLTNDALVDTSNTFQLAVRLIDILCPYNGEIYSVKQYISIKEISDFKL